MSDVEVINLENTELRDFFEPWSHSSLREKEDERNSITQCVEVTSNINERVLFPKDLSDVPFFIWNESPTINNSGFLLEKLYDEKNQDNSNNKTLFCDIVNIKMLYKGS